MTEETYKRSVEIKNRLAHIDKVLELLNQITENPGNGTVIKAALRETGFIAHPEEVRLNQYDIDVMIKALREEKLRYIGEFQRL